MHCILEKENALKKFGEDTFKKSKSECEQSARNTFHDAAYSINCPFLGDKWIGSVQSIYEKLFYGCNILVKDNEEHYRPKWSKKERRWTAKVMKDGFRILEKGLDRNKDDRITVSGYNNKNGKI